jgi:transcriptional regulator with XRE-family HTH domain
VERLEAKGLSKADLARRLDMEPPQLTRILSGSANVTMETIARLETALGENLIIIPVPSEQRIPFEIQSQETTEIWGAQAFLPKYKMADCRG